MVLPSPPALVVCPLRSTSQNKAQDSPTVAGHIRQQSPDFAVAGHRTGCIALDDFRYESSAHQPTDSVAAGNGAGRIAADDHAAGQLADQTTGVRLAGDLTGGVAVTDGAIVVPSHQPADHCEAALNGTLVGTVDDRGTRAEGAVIRFQVPALADQPSDKPHALDGSARRVTVPE